MTQTHRDRIEQVRALLARHHQDHILRFADRISADQQRQLLSDIESLDLEALDALVEQYVRQEPHFALPDEILPPATYPIEPGSKLREKYRQARRRGERLIAEGKVAAFVVAGGVGTRLNFDGPKGCFPATPIKKKVLFQVFAETIRAAEQRWGGVIPWYVMTSRANHEATERAFAECDHFGLEPSNVMLFTQGMMPSFDRDGRILLAEKHRLAMSPDGHGGSLRALYRSGALADIKRRGVEFISYWQVDNPQVRLIDPLFIGLHAEDAAEMSSKAVIKCDPLEKVGNFTLVNDRVTVIEYSDLPEDLARKQDGRGRYVFELGSIAIHLISRSFVERINEHGFSLPWHRADKKVAYVDEHGEPVQPNKPNGVKLETFIFDALPLAARSIILTIDRVEEFAPIKNAEGVDSAESSRVLQIERFARWLESAGVRVPRKSDGAVDAVIEISPFFALDAGQLQEKKSLLPAAIQPGQQIVLE
ncbi:MAG: UDPGP type 1 family protein [Sedimentisphaerales bacterium]|nr:UDPGP type 1 family protein [Sedimentisphaerales bacterium]